VGKNKLARWAEMETFSNVIQPGTDHKPGTNHPLRGQWRKLVFRNDNPVVLELGCGKGEYTTGLSALLPGCNYVGVDIKGARIWRGAKTATENKTVNAAFLRTRIEFIGSFFGNDEVDEIWITFPDPHPGKRNSNKRLTCPWFLNTYRSFLKDRGIIHLKTDNRELFDYTLRLASENSPEILFSTTDMDTMSMEKVIVPGDLYPEPDDTGQKARISEGILLIKTHYESMFRDKGLKINYLAFRLEKDKVISNDWERKSGE